MLPRVRIKRSFLSLGLEDFFKFGFNGGSQLKGVQGFELGREIFFNSRRYQGGIQYPLVRCFRGIITPDGFGSNSFFSQEFDGGQEEVLKPAPFLGIEVVEQGNDLGVI